MLYLKKVALHASEDHLTLDTTLFSEDSLFQETLIQLDKNGFCTANIHEKNIADIYCIADAIKEVAEKIPQQVALIQKLFHRFPELKKLSKTDIQALAPDTATAMHVLMACYHLLKDFSSPTPLRFIQDYVTFGGLPFSHEASTSIHQHFQPLLPINSIKKLNFLHTALRRIVPHADPSEYCFARCVWIADKLQKLGLTVGTINAAHTYGLYPPKYSNQDVSWSHHIAPTVKITTCYGLISKTYIMDILLDKAVTQYQWFKSIGLAKKDEFSAFKKIQTTELSDLLQKHLEEKTEQLQHLYFTEIRGNVKPEETSITAPETIRTLDISSNKRSLDHRRIFIDPDV